MITPAEQQKLDHLVALGDATGVSPKGISYNLFKAGQRFNPQPATKQDINDYITTKNRTRPTPDQLPSV